MLLGLSRAIGTLAIHFLLTGYRHCMLVVSYHISYIIQNKKECIIRSICPFGITPFQKHSCMCLCFRILMHAALMKNENVRSALSHVLTYCWYMIQWSAEFSKGIAKGSLHHTEPKFDNNLNEGRKVENLTWQCRSITCILDRRSWNGCIEAKPWIKSFKQKTLKSLGKHCLK